jgi:hypothetical protein
MRSPTLYLRDILESVNLIKTALCRASRIQVLYEKK